MIIDELDIEITDMGINSFEPHISKFIGLNSENFTQQNYNSHMESKQYQPSGLKKCDTMITSHRRGIKQPA